MSNQSNPAEQKYIDIGPKNFTEAMGLFRVIILDANRTGREGILPEIARMAEFADLLPEALAIIKEARRMGHDEFTPAWSKRVDAFIDRFSK